MTTGACARPAVVVGLMAGLVMVALAGAAGGQGRSGRDQAPRAVALTGVEFLAGAYDAILDASFAQAERQLQNCAAPPEACLVLNVVRRWWQIQLDPLSTARDADFLSAADAAIAAADAWTVRQPGNAEAWFYLGGTYAARVQWRVLRGETLAAARDGKRIRTALDRAIALAPGLDDAYFGLGMYQYYADVAPTAAKVLRWLLLLPGGDRQAGLAQMVRAREGRLLRGEAEYQLHLIYLWYERDPAGALALLESLRKVHRENPLFWRLIAEVEDTYIHDVPASLQTYAALLAAANRGRVNEPELARAEARLGMARQLDALHGTDRAVSTLEDLVREMPARPYAAVSRAHLQIGAARARLGDRAGAEAAYRAAIAAAPRDDPSRVKDGARRGLQRLPSAGAGDAYRLSIEGWRRLEHKDAVGAARALARAAVLAPDDPVIAYRFGRALDAQDQVNAARTQYEFAIARHQLAPPSIASAIFFHTGRLLEREKQIARAIERYTRAANLFGAGADARRVALQALARVQ